jgi:hypothetical protein
LFCGENINDGEGSGSGVLVTQVLALRPILRCGGAPLQSAGVIVDMAGVELDGLIVPRKERLCVLVEEVRDVDVSIVPSFGEISRK